MFQNDSNVIDERGDHHDFLSAAVALLHPSQKRIRHPLKTDDVQTVLLRDQFSENSTLSETLQRRQQNQSWVYGKEYYLSHKLYLFYSN
jgi:hypothetical protein